jgi:hypothetical protein
MQTFEVPIAGFPEEAGGKARFNVRSSSHFERFKSRVNFGMNSGPKRTSGVAPTPAAWGSGETNSRKRVT